MRITLVMASILLLLTTPALAHEMDMTTWEKLGIPDPVAVMLWSAAVPGIIIIASVYYKKHMGDHAKKLAFILISVPILIATLYLSGSTIYLNINSATGGPVHWHADYEIWACGELHELVDPKGLENRVGTPVVHEHNDNRIHVEGVLLEMEEASLHEYFESVGGEFEKDSLSMPTEEGMMKWRNGDLCNGKPARWHMFVNEQPSEEMGDYVISSYPVVPPGDFIKFVFTEKEPSEINTGMLEAP